MLGLPDVCYAFVVLHRVRQRCRARVTDVIAPKTARVAMYTQKESYKGIVFRPKREEATQVCAAVLRLRVLAYRISFTVLARSPRTASSKLSATSAIVFTSTTSQFELKMDSDR